jgi:hypothetical protein
MEKPPASDTARGSAAWPVVTAALVAASWGVFVLTQGYGFRLVAEYGPAPDVVDSLSRSAAVARRTLPYYAAALLIGVLAALTLVTRARRGWPKVLKVVATIALVPTLVLQGLACVVAAIFAN